MTTIQLLPLELLVEIFFYYILSGSRLTIALVCSRWARIVQDSPLLWTIINIHQDCGDPTYSLPQVKNFILCIEKSGNRHLDIMIILDGSIEEGLFGEEISKLIADLLLKISHRIIRLVIVAHFGCSDCITPILLSSTVVFPKLIELCLPEIEDEFLTHTPNLQSIQMFWLHNHKFHDFVGLTRVGIEGVYIHPMWNHLGLLPNLSVLTLKGPLNSPLDDIHKDMRVIHLRNLQMICLYGKIDLWLEMLEVDSVETVRIFGNKALTSMPWCPNKESNKKGVIRCKRLEYFGPWMTFSPLFGILGHFTSLTTLSLPSNILATFETLLKRFRSRVPVSLRSHRWAQTVLLPRKLVPNPVGVHYGHTPLLNYQRLQEDSLNGGCFTYS